MGLINETQESNDPKKQRDPGELGKLVGGVKPAPIPPQPEQTIAAPPVEETTLPATQPLGVEDVLEMPSAPPVGSYELPSESLSPSAPSVLQQQLANPIQQTSNDPNVILQQAANVEKAYRSSKQVEQKFIQDGYNAIPQIIRQQNINNFTPTNPQLTQEQLDLLRGSVNPKLDNRQSSLFNNPFFAGIGTAVRKELGMAGRNPATGQSFFNEFRDKIGKRDYLGAAGSFLNMFNPLAGRVDVGDFGTGILAGVVYGLDHNRNTAHGAGTDLFNLITGNKDPRDDRPTVVQSSLLSTATKGAVRSADFPDNLSASRPLAVGVGSREEEAQEDLPSVVQKRFQEGKATKADHELVVKLARDDKYRPINRLPWTGFFNKWTAHGVRWAADIVSDDKKLLEAIEDNTARALQLYQGLILSGIEDVATGGLIGLGTGAVKKALRLPDQVKNIFNPPKVGATPPQSLTTLTSLKTKPKVDIPSNISSTSLTSNKTIPGTTPVSKNVPVDSRLRPPLEAVDPLAVKYNWEDLQTSATSEAKLPDLPPQMVRTDDFPLNDVYRGMGSPTSQATVSDLQQAVSEGLLSRPATVSESVVKLDPLTLQATEFPKLDVQTVVKYKDPVDVVVTDLTQPPESLPRYISPIQTGAVRRTNASLTKLAILQGHSPIRTTPLPTARLGILQNKFGDVYKPWGIDLNKLNLDAPLEHATSSGGQMLVDNLLDAVIDPGNNPAVIKEAQEFLPQSLVADTPDVIESTGQYLRNQQVFDEVVEELELAKQSYGAMERAVIENINDLDNTLDVGRYPVETNDSLADIEYKEPPSNKPPEVGLATDDVASPVKITGDDGSVNLLEGVLTPEQEQQLLAEIGDIPPVKTLLELDDVDSSLDVPDTELVGGDKELTEWEKRAAREQGKRYLYGDYYVLTPYSDVDPDSLKGYNLTFEEQSALDLYIGTWAEYINDYLNIPVEKRGYNPKMEDFWRNLSTGLEKLPKIPEKNVLYRYIMDYGRTFETIKGMTPGEEVLIPSYQSMTDLEGLEAFADRPVRMEVYNVKNGYYLPHNHNEHEVLVKEGTRLKFIGKHEDNTIDGSQIVYMFEDVSDEPADLLEGVLTPAQEERILRVFDELDPNRDTELTNPMVGEGKSKEDELLDLKALTDPNLYLALDVKGAYALEPPQIGIVFKELAELSETPTLNDLVVFLNNHIQAKGIGDAHMADPNTVFGWMLNNYKKQSELVAPIVFSTMEVEDILYEGISTVLNGDDIYRIIYPADTLPATGKDLPSAEQLRFEYGAIRETDPRAVAKLDLGEFEELESTIGLAPGEREVLIDYIQSSYDVNATLRDAKGKIPSDYKEAIKLLDSTLEKLPAYPPTTFYRYLKDSSYQRFNELKVGQVYTDYGYTSLTYDDAIPHFSDRPNILYIKSSRGRTLHYGMTQGEVLLPRGTELQLLARAEEINDLTGQVANVLYFEDVTGNLPKAYANAVNNIQTLFHGSKSVFDITNVDPVQGAARSELGVTGIHLTEDRELAEIYAGAIPARNAPPVETREIKTAGSVYQVMPELNKVIKANDALTDDVRDALKVAISQSAFSAPIKKSLKARLKKATKSYIDYMNEVEQTIAKYMDGDEFPEETALNFQRLFTQTLRELGYDAVVYIPPSMKAQVTLLGKQGNGIKLDSIVPQDISMVGTDVLQQATQRYNADVRAMDDYPKSELAKTNAVESRNFLQTQMTQKMGEHVDRLTKAADVTGDAAVEAEQRLAKEVEAVKLQKEAEDLQTWEKANERQVDDFDNMKEDFC